MRREERSVKEDEPAWLAGTLLFASWANGHVRRPPVIVFPGGCITIRRIPSTVGINSTAHRTDCGLFPGPSRAMAASLVIDTFGKSGVCEFLIAAHK